MAHALETISLFLAGLLAGEELVIRFGVRGPLAGLDDAAHLRFRQALILKLRILVPAIFFPALLTSAAEAFLERASRGAPLRLAAVVALLAFIVTTLLGTVPINQAALAWNPRAPPANWRALIQRWERLDSVRCALAVVAFALLLLAAERR